MHGHNKPHQTNMTMVRQCFGDNTWVGAAFYRGFLGCCTPLFMFLTCSSCFSAHAWSAEKHFIDIVNEVNHHIDIVGTGHLKEGYREGFQLASGCQLTEDHSMDTFLYDMLPLVILMHNQREWGFHMFSCLEVKLWNLYWCASTISLGPTPQKNCSTLPHWTPFHPRLYSSWGNKVWRSMWRAGLRHSFHGISQEIFRRTRLNMLNHFDLPEPWSWLVKFGGIHLYWLIWKKENIISMATSHLGNVSCDSWSSTAKNFSRFNSFRWLGLGWLKEMLGHERAMMWHYVTCFVRFTVSRLTVCTTPK